MSLSKWRVKASRQVLRDRWIAVRADDCVTEDGVEISPYYVFDYPDWVHVVALDSQNRVLLIRQYRHGSGAISIELPAGAIDPADADPLAAGARELLEETGFGGTMSLSGVASPNPATHSNRIHTVVARNVTPVGERRVDPTERTEPFFVSIEEAVRLATSGEMVAAIQVASLLSALLDMGALELSRDGSPSRD